MKKESRRRTLICLLLLLLLAGCAIAERPNEKDAAGQDYLADVLSGEITEIKFIGGGETVTLTDAQEIASAVALMEQFDVVFSEDTDIKAPGAASIDVIFQYANATEKEITFPCFAVDGVTYKALYDAEGVYFPQLAPVVHWEFAASEPESRGLCRRKAQRNHIRRATGLRA